MEQEILKLATSQGIWAVLFVGLLFYILRKQEDRDERAEQREENYQNIIGDLTNKFDIISHDVKEIKNHIFNKE